MTDHIGLFGAAIASGMIAPRNEKTPSNARLLGERGADDGEIGYRYRAPL